MLSRGNNSNLLMYRVAFGIVINKIYTITDTSHKLSIYRRIYYQKNPI